MTAFAFESFIHPIMQFVCPKQPVDWEGEPDFSHYLVKPLRFPRRCEQINARFRCRVQHSLLRLRFVFPVIENDLVHEG
jgi:hypothetical protein